MVADTVLRGSVSAPLGLSLVKLLAAKPQGLRPLGFAASGLPLKNPLRAVTLLLSTVLASSTLSLRDSFSTLPLGFSTVAFTQMRGYQLIVGSRQLKKIDIP